MLNYHKNGVTLTLELQSVDELEALQEGLSNALYRLAEIPDGNIGRIIQAITQVIEATHLTSEQHKVLFNTMQRMKVAA